MNYSSPPFLAHLQILEAVFFMYTALEELGKAALLVDTLKQSPAKAEFIKVKGFRNHTRKLRRAVEGLAGTIVRIDKHLAERTKGALDALDRAAKSCVGNDMNSLCSQVPPE